MKYPIGSAGRIGPIFEKEADFEGATFKIADFDEAIFRKEADFKGATFEERASFNGATFEEGVDFTNVVFETPPSFKRATFECRPDFQDTRFAARADDLEEWIIRLAAIASLTGYDLRDLLERSGHSVGNVRNAMKEVSAKGKKATNTGKQVADRWSNEARDLFNDFVEASKSNTESTENEEDNNS